MVRQPLGGCRPRKRRPTAPPPLSSDTQWAHTRKPGLRELRPRSSSMNRGDELARWLVQQAARSAPDSLSERLEEEWLADMEARKGHAARLRFGLGCCWATRVIAHEHCAASVLAAASATGSKTMTAYVQHDDDFFSRRTITVLAIIGLHAAIIYAFATGFGSRMIHVLAPPFDYVSVTDPPTHQVP